MSTIDFDRHAGCLNRKANFLASRARVTFGTLRNPNCLGEVRTMHPVGKTRRWSRVTIAAIATLLLGAMFAQNHVDATEGSLVPRSGAFEMPQT